MYEQFRPPILGIAGLSVSTTDPTQAKHFYGGVLGLSDVAYEDGSNATAGVNVFAVNDRQRLEVRYCVDGCADRCHIVLETSDLDALTRYIQSTDVELRLVPTTIAGYEGVCTSDPDGHRIYFVQIRDCGRRGVIKECLLDRLIHVGITARDPKQSDEFYRRLLGFSVEWAGGATSLRTDWIQMKVPEGTDCIEYMLNVSNKSRRGIGIVHHLAVGVRDIRTVYQALQARAVRPLERPKVGRDGKWQLNIYDPDLTRVEILQL